MKFPKHNLTPKEQSQRREANIRYHNETRPHYLLELATRQGRLKRNLETLPGTTMKQKMMHLDAHEFPLCEARLEATHCKKQGGFIAATIHHKRGRERKSGVELTNDTSYFMGLCKRCHDYIETNRGWAMQHGYLVSRNSLELVQES
jgi:5-methylcytosine-specific restriction endonuclease McrA